MNSAKDDVLGNAVKQTVNCCRKKTFTYTAVYRFAYLEAGMRGEGAPQLSTSTVYDFNTGLVTHAPDENEQETVFSYDAASLRPARVTHPADGGQTDFLYHDALLDGPGTPRYSREAAAPTFETGRTTEVRRYSDGRGSLVRTLSSHTEAQGWVTSDVEYDRMGRVRRTSNPYYSAGETAAINPSGGWTANTEFDNLSRVTEVTVPNATKITTVYASSVVTTTELAGCKRRSVSDALGRLKELHEPDEDGNLGPLTNPAQKTSYEHDALGNVRR